MPQEILRPLLGRIVEGDPDASGDEHLLFFEDKGRLQYGRDPLPICTPSPTLAMSSTKVVNSSPPRGCLRGVGSSSRAQQPL
jgi:hypothetical protein